MSRASHEPGTPLSLAGSCGLDDIETSTACVSSSSPALRRRGDLGDTENTAPAERVAVTQLQPNGNTNSVFPSQKLAPEKATLKIFI